MRVGVIAREVKRGGEQGKGRGGGGGYKRYAASFWVRGPIKMTMATQWKGCIRCSMLRFKGSRLSFSASWSTCVGFRG